MSSPRACFGLVVLSQRLPLKFLRAVLTPFVSEGRLTSPHMLSRSFGVLCDVAVILHSLNKSEIGYQLCPSCPRKRIWCPAFPWFRKIPTYFSSKCCIGWNTLILTVSLLTCFEEQNMYWDFGEANGGSTCGNEMGQVKHLSPVTLQTWAAVKCEGGINLFWCFLFLTMGYT